jgi:hypothetical protein
MWQDKTPMQGMMWNEIVTKIVMLFPIHLVHLDGDISNFHSSKSNPITLTTPKLYNFKTNALDCNASKLVGLWKLQNIC